MKNRLVIAIDGFSSTGKSTYAKMLADEYGLVHIDTGAMYRAVTLYALENGLIKNDILEEKAIIGALSNLEIELRYNKEDKRNETFLNGKNVDEDIRKMEVSTYVSRIAAISEVRKDLAHKQREMSKKIGVVMDGRDITTVVLPDADVKLFITASSEERARRRYLELQSRGDDKTTLEEILENLKFRDHLDTTREVDPMRIVEDAVVVDNTNLTKKETYQEIKEAVEDKIKGA